MPKMSVLKMAEEVQFTKHLNSNFIIVEDSEEKTNIVIGSRMKRPYVPTLIILGIFTIIFPFMWNYHPPLSGILYIIVIAIIFSTIFILISRWRLKIKRFILIEKKRGILQYGLKLKGNKMENIFVSHFDDISKIEEEPYKPRSATILASLSLKFTVLRLYFKEECDLEGILQSNLSQDIQNYIEREFNKEKRSYDLHICQDEFIVILTRLREVILESMAGEKVT